MLGRESKKWWVNTYKGAKKVMNGPPYEPICILMGAVGGRAVSSS